MILRNAMPPKRFEVPFGTGTGRKPETPWTLGKIEAHIELHVGSIDEVSWIPLSSDTFGVLSKLVE